MEQAQFDRKSVLQDLTKSKHGKLSEYIPTGIKATKFDPEFFGHLLVYNLANGEIRDTKVALPVLALRNLKKDTDADLAENAVANLMSLNPRSLMKAMRFNKEVSKEGHIISGGYRRMLERALREYLEVREANKGRWDATVLQHRSAMKELYTLAHKKPSAYVQSVLFDKKPPRGSVFEKVQQLSTMPAQEAAGTILNHKLPAQIVLGALGRKKSEMEANPELILAILQGMSGQQLINNTKLLQGLGVFDSQMLKAEYAQALERAKKDKRVSTLKAGTAIKAMKGSKGDQEPEDDVTKEIIAKLSDLQEARLIEHGGIEGDWVVLGDKSSSMHRAIKVASEISATLAKSVKGKVHLIFFNDTPHYMDVTGKTLEEIKSMTSRVRADGMTSCGCGLKYLQDKGIEVNGVALVSDGGDNSTPLFGNAYVAYAKKLGYEPPVYYFKVQGDTDKVLRDCQRNDIPVTEFDLGYGQIDYYSLPNLIKQMKTTRYSLVDEIMNYPLLTLKEVLV